MTSHDMEDGGGSGGEEMPVVDCQLSDLVNGKFQDNTLTLTSFSIKNAGHHQQQLQHGGHGLHGGGMVGHHHREETVASVTAEAYNHIASQLNLSSVQTVVEANDISDAEMDEGRIVIDTGE